MRHPFRKPSVILSLILLAACVVFWHRGNRVRDVIGLRWSHEQGRIEFASYDGGIDLLLQRPGASSVDWPEEIRENGVLGGLVDPQTLDNRFVCTSRVLSMREEERDPYVSDTDNSSIWRGAGPLHFMTSNNVLYFQLRSWLVSLAFAFLPAIALARTVRSKRRIDRNRCATCGYDLRHSKDRCPECGTAISPADENPPKIESPVAS